MAKKAGGVSSTPLARASRLELELHLTKEKSRKLRAILRLSVSATSCGSGKILKSFRNKILWILVRVTVRAIPIDA